VCVRVCGVCMCVNESNFCCMCVEGVRHACVWLRVCVTHRCVCVCVCVCEERYLNSLHQSHETSHTGIQYRV